MQGHAQVRAGSRRAARTRRRSTWNGHRTEQVPVVDGYSPPGCPHTRLGPEGPELTLAFRPGVTWSWPPAWPSHERRVREGITGVVTSRARVARAGRCLTRWHCLSPSISAHTVLLLAWRRTPHLLARRSTSRSPRPPALSGVAIRGCPGPLSATSIRKPRPWSSNHRRQ